MAEAGDALLVETESGSSVSLPADKILVTVGRKPVTEGWGLEELDLDMDGRSSASTTSAAPRCAASTRSAT